jgi:hypothetical protein
VFQRIDDKFGCDQADADRRSGSCPTFHNVDRDAAGIVVDH